MKDDLSLSSLVKPYTLDLIKVSSVQNFLQFLWDLLNVTHCVQHRPVTVAVEFEQNEIIRYELNHLNKTRAFLSNQTHNAIAREGLDNECTVQSAKLFAFSSHLENLTVRAVDVLCRLHGPAPTLILVVIVILL